MTVVTSCLRQYVQSFGDAHEVGYASIYSYGMSVCSYITVYKYNINIYIYVCVLHFEKNKKG